MPRLSIATRAGLAVALMIGFYVLALGIAGALLWLVYAQWAYLDRVYVKLTFAAVAGAGLILWAVLPRLDKFDAPGPELEATNHPRLFAELEQIAAATQQEMPREVFAVSDVNAWVAQRGGVMGAGSRRVMGLGLPLLDTLTVSELRAVIAHEFGHYHGGDTKLGPWIYKTRAAIERTLHHLGEHNELLMLPFLWYGNAFLRITHAVSRNQEFAADALAAQVAGRGAMARALRTIHGAGSAFGFYWSTEVVPAIERGFRPPLAAGFRAFAALPQIAGQISARLELEIAEGTADPYDTHPSLRERLAALEALPPSAEPVFDDRPASSLLGGADALEPAIVDSMLREGARGTLAPLAWEDAGEKLWMPIWREQAGAHVGVLREMTTAALPAAARDPVRLVMAMHLAMHESAVSEAEIARAHHIIGASLAILLHARAFAVSALPGEPVICRRGVSAIEPFAIMPALARGELDADRWKTLCAELGIDGAILGDFGAAGGALPSPQGEASPTGHPT